MLQLYQKIISENFMNSTLIGTFAILMWSTLALFTVGAGNIPPFELLTISFTIAFFIGLIWCKKSKNNLLDSFKQPLHVWLVGIGGLFGYHFFYFLAIKNAPALQANLINYLWPLLIVLFSAFLPNEKLRSYHLIGAFFGFLGASLLIIDKSGFNSLHFNLSIGYMYALFAALLWSSYSVLSRKLAHVPTYVVGAFCLVVALLSLICHLYFETTIIPTKYELLSAIMLGLAPVGGAFYVWDIGMKKGDIKLLGSLSYATPLLSTLLLLIFGLSTSTWIIWLSCFLIITGSLISSGEYLRKLKF